MNQLTSFGDLLEAADRLSIDDQQALIDVLRRRLALAERKRIENDVLEARKDFAEGKAVPTTVDELMNDILS